MIDSHCHLNQVDYLLPVDQIIKESLSAGVEKMLVVACDPVEWNEIIELLQKHECLYGALGIHPEYVDKVTEDNLIELKNNVLNNKKIIALGEIGLDYHENFSKEKQFDLFYKQILLANLIKKPIMIHTRDAEEDTIKILEKAKNEGLLESGGVIHCFTGNEKLLRFALNLGFYISASGITTFKSAKELCDLFKLVPLDKLLIETDSPWLSPVPHRGKINQPAFVRYTLEKLAEIKSVSVQTMEQITTNNFFDLYLRDKI